MFSFGSGHICPSQQYTFARILKHFYNHTSIEIFKVNTQTIACVSYSVTSSLD